MSISRMVYTGTSYFGEYAREKIKDEIEKHHFHKALLVTDKDLIKAGVAGKIEEVLIKNEVPYEIYDDIKPNPTIGNVQHGVSVYQMSGSDFIIAVGGGSVIDTSKGIAVIANNPENLDVISLEGPDKSKNMAVPIIAVPTTAGTGSETTMDYVITNTLEKRKMACMDSKVVPVAAILDTEIMASLPIKLTAATAMDALTHAVESFLAKGAFSFSEMLSLKAVSLIADNFLKVLEKPDDFEVRKELAIAQYMAGMSFTNVGLGIVHSMAHPLSAFYDIPHGVANALILPNVLEFNAKACPEKMIELAAAFDKNFDKKADSEKAADLCVDTIRKFNTAAGLPQKLIEIGVKAEDINDLSESAFSDVSTLDNPVDVTVEDIKKLYLSMLE